MATDLTSNQPVQPENEIDLIGLSVNLSSR